MTEAIAGVQIMLLVLGIVEAAKKFGLNGNKSFALAIILGVFFGGLEYGVANLLIPVVAIPYVEWIIYSLAYGLAATGFYDLGKRFMGAR